jgi:hypothetical protein
MANMKANLNSERCMQNMPNLPGTMVRSIRADFNSDSFTVGV